MAKTGKFCLVATGPDENDISIMEIPEKSRWQPQIGKKVPPSISMTPEKTVVVAVLHHDTEILARIAFDLDDASGVGGNFVSMLHKFGVAWTKATSEANEYFPIVP